MAPVLWVIAVLGTITVIHRMYFTWQETRRIEGAQLREEASAGVPESKPLSARVTRA
jgi:CDP-diacylglycerol--glycerol-3-phosphate 3-phosphatidyltransferase